MSGPIAAGSWNIKETEHKQTKHKQNKNKHDQPNNQSTNWQPPANNRKQPTYLSDVAEDESSPVAAGSWNKQNKNKHYQPNNQSTNQPTDNHHDNHPQTTSLPARC